MFGVKSCNIDLWASSVHSAACLCSRSRKLTSDVAIRRLSCVTQLSISVFVYRRRGIDLVDFCLKKSTMSNAGVRCRLLKPVRDNCMDVIRTCVELLLWFAAKVSVVRYVVPWRHRLCIGFIDRTKCVECRLPNDIIWNHWKTSWNCRVWIAAVNANRHSLTVAQWTWD